MKTRIKLFALTILATIVLATTFSIVQASAFSGDCSQNLLQNQNRLQSRCQVNSHNCQNEESEDQSSMFQYQNRMRSRNLDQNGL